MKRMLNELIGQIQGSHFDKITKTATFDRGPGFVQIKSAEEPDSLRGMGVDFVAVDEAAHIKNLKYIWEQCLMPCLLDRNGKAVFITTPKGFNFFHELDQRSKTDSEWASFHYKTSDNPFLPKGAYESMAKQLPGLVKLQELDAEYVQLAGALFKREYFKVVSKLPDNITHRVRCWDLAFTTKTVSDYTSGARINLTTTGDIYIDHLVHGRWEWPEAVRMISQVCKMDGHSVHQYVEAVGAQTGFVQTLHDDPLLSSYVIRPHHVRDDKIERAMPLLTKGEQGKLWIVEGEWNNKLIDELLAFPESDHDDIVDSCSGGLQCLTLGPTGAPQAFSSSVPRFIQSRERSVSV
jgi:predicted phage terminase large subunit-like protein